MKLLLITMLVAFVTGDVSHIKSGEAAAEIIKQELEMGLEGQYNWSYETQNNISAREQGALKNPQSENAAEVVQGGARWIAPDGQVVEFSYIADENGYQPQGSHIPTPPPIPVAIARGLEFIRQNPPKPERA